MTGNRTIKIKRPPNKNGKSNLDYIKNDEIIIKTQKKRHRQ